MYYISCYVYIYIIIKVYTVDFPVVICNDFCILPPRYTTEASDSDILYT